MSDTDLRIHSLHLHPVKSCGSLALREALLVETGLTAVFLVAGIVPTFLAVAAILIPRLDRDELAHPLDHTPE